MTRRPTRGPPAHWRAPGVRTPGPAWRWTSSGSCCSHRPGPRRPISTAVRDRAATSTPTRSLRSTSEPAPCGGTTRWCGTTCGIAISPRRPRWCNWSATAFRSTPSRCRRSRGSSSSSTGRPATPCSRSPRAEAAQSLIPGEGVAPAQPQSAITFTRQQFEVTARNPEAREYVRAIVSRLDRRPFAPPSLEGSLIYPAYAGGANWGGAAFDPSTHRLIINAQEIGGIAQIQRAGGTDDDYSLVDRNGIRDQDGLPGNTPPWGTLTSLDLATGRFDWVVPLGDYPSLEGAGYGAENYGGPVVTAGGLIFIAATPDAKLRAFDTRDGALLWQGRPAGRRLLDSRRLQRRRATVRRHCGRRRPDGVHRRAPSTWLSRFRRARWRRRPCSIRDRQDDRARLPVSGGGMVAVRGFEPRSRG